MTGLRAGLKGLRTTPRDLPTVLAAALLSLLAGIGAAAGGTARGGAPKGGGIAAPAQAAPAGRHATAGRREARAIEHTRRATPFIARGSPHRREVALTFDDGPGPDTPRIIGVLRRLHAAATFFVVGQQADRFGSILRAEGADGFAIGNHTQNHAALGRLRPPAQRHQLWAAAQRAHRYGVQPMGFFRPPYGSYNAATLQVASELGLLMVLWSTDTGDYRRPGVNAIVRAALRRASPGAIVLMHDGGGPRRQTVRALPRIVRALRRRGFRLVTVPQMLADAPAPRRQLRPPGSGQ
jgi:peptidoglycan/xylan/chitin deacetylase (PgdA/CDA1 family)